MATGPLSLVVLPFVNLTGVQHHDFVIDGITDRLTSDLARIENSFVVARAAATVYRGSGSTSSRSGKSSGCVTRSEAACGRAAMGCGSMPSWSTPRTGSLCGPAALTSRPPSPPRCRTRSSIG